MLPRAFQLFGIISVLGENDDSQIQKTNPCCCYTSNDRQSPSRDCRKAQICLCLEDTRPSKIHIFSYLKDKKTFRSNIVIVKSFTSFSNFWYINFTIEQKRCNICHSEYISHVNWINQYEERAKSESVLSKKNSNVEWEREESTKIEAKKIK